MKIEMAENQVTLEKELSVIDQFVLDFIQILQKLNIKYTIISGYTVLLFGRQRITEDVDIFLEELKDDKLEELFTTLEKDYWIINANSFEVAREYYKEKIAWRVAKKETISPNMEIKRVKGNLDLYSLNNPLKVILNKTQILNISPLELQIAYKLFLSSRKDIEDARFLYQLFKDKVNFEKLKHFAKELNVQDNITLLSGLV